MSGGRLEILPPLPFVDLQRPDHHPFPLGRPVCSLHRLGRHALFQGVRACGLKAGDEVLVPAYHHGSEVEALVRAGLQCRFYGEGESLEPDAAELEALVGPRTRALLLIHYLGLPQDARRWRGWCDARGLLLIEDAAQAWLASIEGRPVGSFGHIAIFCLYKSFGVPDGAALVSRARPAASDGAGGLGVGGVALRHAAWLMGRSPALARVGATVRRERRYSAEEDIRLGDTATGASAATSFLLPRVADPAAASRRRANYRLLLTRLGRIVPPQFAELPDGASPFVFPIETARRSELLERLARQAIEAIAFWSVPHHELAVSQFPYVRALRERIVGLPIHQELRPRDIEQLARAVSG
jgi:dTDP-4-amino-4,6-dideoxygalactose transaminase